MHMVLSTIDHAQSNVNNSIGIELQTNGWITYGSHKHLDYMHGVGLA